MWVSVLQSRYCSGSEGKDKETVGICIVVNYSFTKIGKSSLNAENVAWRMVISLSLRLLP